jgi:hypothetical protein
MEDPTQDINLEKKYTRTHLRPIAKSIYNDRATTRLNGSLNQATGCSGLNIMEKDAKTLTNFAMQSAMTKTFNLSILNNTFNQGVTLDLGKTGKNTSLSRTMNSSPRGVRTISVESYAPFTVIPNAKIPDLSENRREQMAERTLMLLRKPKH